MVSRYSCSATVAWDSADMFLILVQRLHALCSQLHERAGGGREVRVTAGGEGGQGGGGGREVRVTAGDEGERVGDRRVEADVVKAPPERAAERDAAGPDRVAEPAQREIERGLDVLDLDLRLDRHARALGALGKLAASRVVGAEARVVEDQRRVGE